MSKRFSEVIRCVCVVATSVSFHNEIYDGKNANENAPRIIHMRPYVSTIGVSKAMSMTCFFFPFCFVPEKKNEIVTKYFTSSDSTDISCVPLLVSRRPKIKTHVRTICSARAWSTQLTVRVKWRAEELRTNHALLLLIKIGRRETRPDIFKVIAYHCMAFAVRRCERCFLFFLFFCSANKMTIFLHGLLHFSAALASATVALETTKETIDAHYAYARVWRYPPMLWYINTLAAYERIVLLFPHSFMLNVLRSLLQTHLLAKMEFTCTSHAPIFFPFNSSHFACSFEHIAWYKKRTSNDNIAEMWAEEACVVDTSDSFLSHIYIHIFFLRSIRMS